ncbi:MAG: NFACT family protein [Oscillospiraceae bacterium]|nr:NFACT family protein [Oscillospiraceae bacterium]
MPYDAGAASAVCYELNRNIAGGRIEKIFQPTREQIVLLIYSNREHYSLVLDADANSPKVYITNQTAENPPLPYMFYNIFRKYAINAKINSVSLCGFDRIFEFKIDAFDDMGFQKTLYIYVECIRKQSNIILCGDDNGNKKIISAIKTVDFSMSEERQVLPGLLYNLPDPGEKINPLDVTREKFLSDLQNAPSEMRAADYLLSKYQGFSPLVTREIAFRAGKDVDIAVDNIDRQTLWFYFSELVNKIKNNIFAPVMLSGENESLIDFSYTDIRQYGNKAVSKTFNSMSELVDYYFYKKDYDNRIRQRSQDIFKVLTNASSRLSKKIKLLEKDLQECENKEKYRIYGDLITANIYRLKKGESVYSLEDFYNDNILTDIAAEKNLTPAQNAQKFYKRYNKLKSAEYHLTKQIEAAQGDISYVDSVFDSLTRALSERELAEIRDELAESGLMRGNKNNKNNNSGKSGKSKKLQKQLPVSKPNEYKSTNGFKILCGKNNKQNDNLTFKIAEKNDIWFHAQKIPGSHVILVCENTGKNPSDIDIEDAAKIAASNSKGKNMPFVPVDYTFARYVKKPGGAKPGFVIYTNFKTATVKPMEQK